MKHFRKKSLTMPKKTEWGTFSLVYCMLGCKKDTNFIVQFLVPNGPICDTLKFCSLTSSQSVVSFLGSGNSIMLCTSSAVTMELFTPPTVFISLVTPSITPWTVLCEGCLMSPALTNDRIFTDRNSSNSSDEDTFRR